MTIYCAVVHTPEHSAILKFNTPQALVREMRSVWVRSILMVYEQNVGWPVENRRKASGS